MSNVSSYNCVNCGSSKISFYPKYYQCDECQRKYPFTSKQQKPVEVEKYELHCGNMSVYETYIDVYGAEILWEDIELISIKAIDSQQGTQLYIRLGITNLKKYKKKMKRICFSNKIIIVATLHPYFFTQAKQKSIMDFFKTLKKDFSEEKSIKKIQLDEIEKTLNNFRKKRKYSLFFLLIFFIFFLFVTIVNFIKNLSNFVPQ